MYQLIVTRNIGSCIWVRPSVVGEVVWVKTMDAARHLIENGFCKWPVVEKVIEPEVKKNRYVNLAGGRLTGSRLSIKSGLGLSSASAGGLVLPHRI